MPSNGDCRECPFLTCNFHPLFHLTLQCIKQEKPVDPPTAKR